MCNNYSIFLGVEREIKVHLILLNRRRRRIDRNRKRIVLWYRNAIMMVRVSRILYTKGQWILAEKHNSFQMTWNYSQERAQNLSQVWKHLKCYCEICGERTIILLFILTESILLRIYSYNLFPLFASVKTSPIKL